MPKKIDHRQVGITRNEAHHDLVQEALSKLKPVAPIKPLSTSQQFQMAQLNRLLMTPTWETPKLS